MSTNQRQDSGSPDGLRLEALSTQRRLSPNYKLSVIAEYDRLGTVLEKNTLLQQEGLSTWHVATWRRDRDAGRLRSRGGTPLGVAEPPRQGDKAALAAAMRRIGRLETELAKRDLALEAVGKAHALLEKLAESADSSFGPTH